MAPGPRACCVLPPFWHGCEAGFALERAAGVSRNDPTCDAYAGRPGFAPSSAERARIWEGALRASALLVGFLFLLLASESRAEEPARRKAETILVDSAPGHAFTLLLPVGPGGGALIVAASAKAAMGVATLAARRGMTIAYADGVGAEILGRLATSLRKQGLRPVLGYGAGAGADALGAARGFDGRLLLGGGFSPTTFGKAIVVSGPDAYWRGLGRGAETIAESKEIRRFYLPGVVALPAGEACAAPLNPLSPDPALRALLAALTEWAGRETAPPASRYPKTLAPTHVWPRLPAPPPLDRPAPAIDSDGNETEGLRLPEVALPIATLTGWNVAKPTGGGTCLQGAAFAFAATKVEREKIGDGRLSLTERYGSRAYFVAAMRSVADRLVKDRLLLPEDADASVARAKTAPF